MTEVVLAINYQPQVRPLTQPHMLTVSLRRTSALSTSPLFRARTTRVVIDCAFDAPRRQVMMDFLKEWETKLQMKITCSQARTAPAQRRSTMLTSRC